MTTRKPLVEKPATMIPAESPVVRGGLLLPVADDETLIESFKRYVALKDKLLEESDYVWFAVFKIGDKQDRNGFTKREDAERNVTELRKRPGIVADLEKKIKKSGCLKLGKAFAISTEIIAEKIDREKGYAEYTIRATAPNGQFKDKTGSCDRAERGKAQAPFDTITATAVTRAEDRALMALLGGETTAEEFDGGAEPATAPPAPPPPSPAKTVIDPPDLSKLTPKERESIDALNKKFTETPPAKQVDLDTLRGRMFAASEEAGFTPEHLKQGIAQKYKKTSSKDLTEQELLEIIALLKKCAEDKDNPLAKK